ncbi:hypothetical protein D3C78_689690 [compost metagenome]
MRVFDARFGEDFFCFGRIKFEWVIFQRARQTDRQEALMDKVLALQQIFGDAFIIHQPARRFPERRIIQQRVGAIAGVKHQIVLLGGRDAQHLHTRFAFQRADLISTQIARHVCVALLDQQTTRGRIRYVFNNDTFQLRCAARCRFVGFQHDGLMGLVNLHLERTAARRVHLQPRVAEVIVFHIRGYLLLIHNRGDRRGENIQRYRWADVRRPVQRERMVIHFFQLAGDIARLPAQHVQNKGRGFIQCDRAGIRENHVFRAQWVAGGKFRVRFQLNGQRFGGGIFLPAFCQNRGDFFRIIAVRLNQTLVKAWHRLNTGKLIGFGGIEAHDVIKTLCDNQCIWRSSGVGGGRQRSQHQ